MIDIYTHFMPLRFFDSLDKVSSKLANIGKRLRSTKQLYDLDERFRSMDKFEHQQIVSLANPPLEDIASATDGANLAVVANDALAELCAKHPDRFPGFAAAVSLLDIESAALEAKRAVTALGAKGIQIFTNVAGHPLDEPRFLPIFETLAELDAPIWLHPARTAEMSDYASEPKSRFEMWWCFGWPYETSVAVTRLVLSGLFDRFPNLNLITHHCGGMIPYYDGRLGPGLSLLGSRTSDEDYSGILPSLKRPHLDYFKNIYADTAMFGGRSGLKAGLDFFGPERIVFATDAPFAPILESVQALDSLNLSPQAYSRVTHENAARLLKI